MRCWSRKKQACINSRMTRMILLAIRMIILMARMIILAIRMTILANTVAIRMIILADSPTIRMIVLPTPPRAPPPSPLPIRAHPSLGPPTLPLLREKLNVEMGVQTYFVIVPIDD